MLNWLNRFNIFCFLDSNQYQLPHKDKNCIAGAGSIAHVRSGYKTALRDIDNFLDSGVDWAFGHLSYDLKNAVEGLKSGNADFIGFPDLYFFCPEIVIQLENDRLEIGIFGNHHQEIFDEISSIEEIDYSKNSYPENIIKSRFTREEYIDRVNSIKQHIQSGDCYELNFCQEFFIENITALPLEVYLRLNEISPNPFSGYYRIDNLYCLSASPERFLKKSGAKIISQPIKGTARRKANEEEDRVVIEQLRNTEKEVAENIMVVDLVRNDLSKISVQGSVKVEELCNIYSFPHVHQMISTISGELKSDLKFSGILSACFPMGSMTGAPKKRVMELIEKYEISKRGLYSGALGYISPDRDFDFNVVIRSLLYNSENKYLSFHTGSAITSASIAEDEYEECVLKGEAIRKTVVNC